MIKLDSPFHFKEEMRLVREVLTSGQLARGVYTQEVESKFAQKFRAKYAILVSSATAGLYSVLSSLGLKKGDEVITTPFTFVATINAILLAGAKPVFVDINEEDFNIDVGLVEQKISSKTKAILGVDLYGQPCDYPKLKELSLSRRNKIYLIADSAQAIGAKIYDKYTLGFVDAQVFSFFQTKNITCGEGGMVLTNKKMICDKVNLIISHGQKRGEKYNYLTIGHNFRPTDIQAAILLCQLSRLDWLNKKRRFNANYLRKNLKNIPGIVPPKVQKERLNVFHRFTIRVTDDFPISRDKLREELLKRDIETGVVYPSPLHLCPFLKKILKNKKGDFPIAEKMAQQVLSLPIHPKLKLGDLNRIVNALQEIYFYYAK